MGRCRYGNYSVGMRFNVDAANHILMWRIYMSKVISAVICYPLTAFLWFVYVQVMVSGISIPHRIVVTLITLGTTGVCALVLYYFYMRLLTPCAHVDLGICCYNKRIG